MIGENHLGDSPYGETLKWSSKISFAALVFLVGLIPSLQVSANDTEIGTRGFLAKAYTCPNKRIHNFCADSLLEDTIEHYSNQSIDRDNINGKINVKQPTSGSGEFTAEYPEDLGEFGEQRYLTYIKLAKLAIEGRAEAESNNEWDESWRLFLQLGFPMLNHQAVHLLHFPPDTVLETQNYFQAATIRRWGSILSENGVSQEDLELYQPVVDIAPVATKASAGNTLHDVYPFFNDYTLAMLEFYASMPDNNIRPIVGGGYPVRQWLGEQTSTPSVRVLDQVLLDVPGGLSVPAIGANHPSFIWYASTSYRDSDPDKAFSIDTRVMTQDLVAACWQVEMSKLAYTDFANNNALALMAARVERDCYDTWNDDKKKRVCELVYIQVYGQDTKEAEATCASRRMLFTANASRASVESIELQVFQRGELSIIQNIE